MLVCTPPPPCRWWPVQPVELKKLPVCAHMCLERVCVRYCGKDESTGMESWNEGTPLTSTAPHCNHKFLSILWSTALSGRKSWGADWLHISATWKSTKSLFKCLPAAPSKLWLRTSQCAQHFKHNKTKAFFSQKLSLVKKKNRYYTTLSGISS